MIEMIEVTKYFGNFRALNNISLNVDKGEILGLLGPNGAGKTTAMRILTCFLPANSGVAKVSGYDVFEDSMEVKRRIGYLPETPPLYHDMTVKTYLNFVANIREIDPLKKAERVKYVVDKAGLSKNVNRVIGTLSKGYKQRVGLAQALLHDPEVLILDEPTVGLDPNQIIEIRDLIKELSEDHTIILSTHILPEVSMVCKRAAIIDCGEIVAVDSIANLEKAAVGRPSWQIKLKLSAEKSLKAIAKEIKNLKLCSLTQEGGFATFELFLDSQNDFDRFFMLCTKSGHIFYEIIPKKASLEDVFTSLTGADDTGAVL